MRSQCRAAAGGSPEGLQQSIGGRFETASPLATETEPVWFTARLSSELDQQPGLDRWLPRHLRLAEAVGVVGAELGEGLVGGAVVVGGGGGDQVELLAELQQVGGLLLAVGRVEGLDAVGAERADQVLDLVGLGDVPVGVGDDGDAAGGADQLDRLRRRSASGAARRPWRPAPGTPRRRGRGRRSRRPPGRCGAGRSRSRRRPRGSRPRGAGRSPRAAGSRRSPRPASRRSCCARSQAGAIFSRSTQ